MYFARLISRSNNLDFALEDSAQHVMLIEQILLTQAFSDLIQLTTLPL